MDHIHAFVGSERFKNKGLGERQEIVWEYLGENVDRRHLSYLFRVEPMDLAEFIEFMREVQLRALSGDAFDNG